MARGRRPGATGSDGPRGPAKDRALRLVGLRWRSREELRRRLRTAGYDAGQIDGALAELEDLGLIDDARLAHAVVSDRATRRLSGDRAIRATLRERGVAPEVAEEALAAAGDEADRARALASVRAVRLAGLGPEAAFRRLFGLLTRRGFGPGVARDAARQALQEVFSPDQVPPEED